MNKTNMQKNIFSKNRKAFTLIELVLYCALLAIVFGSLMPFIFNVVGMGEKNYVQTELSSSARFLAEKIKREIRYSGGINSVVSGPVNQLSLIGNGQNDPVIISASGSNIYIKFGAQSQMQLNSNDISVDQLSFSNNSSPDLKTKNISFIMSVSYRNLGQKQEHKGSINLRSSAEVRKY